jgi:hypothetical protein
MGWYVAAGLTCEQMNGFLTFNNIIGRWFTKLVIHK